MLIVTVHGLRADRVELLVAEAPGLSSLREASLRFSRARTPSPQTTAALVSLLGGRLPRRHGAVSEQAPVQTVDPRLAEIAGEAGYRTVAIVGPTLGARRGLTDGFDQVLKLVDDRERVGAARRQLDAHPGPQLVWLHLSQWTESWAGTAEGPRAGTSGLEPSFEPADVAARYETALRALGGALDPLAERPAAERRRITLLTSDHGWLLGERHGYVGHDGWLYEECLRVPLWLHDSAGQIQPGSSASDVSLHDVPGTLAQLSGLDWKPHDGAVDLLEVRAKAPKRISVFETFEDGPGFAQQALLANGYKLHRPVAEAPGWPNRGRPTYPRLFRLEGGREGRDLAPGAPRVVDTLERLFLVWQSRYGGPLSDRD